MIAALFLSFLATALEQTPPQGWWVVKDSKGLCQIAVPPDWQALLENTGAAVLQEATNAIAVVTSQPAQAFKPLPDTLQRMLGIRKNELFENSAKRVFYQEKVSHRPDEANAYNAIVPGRTGTCSCHVVALPSVAEETAKNIALSLGPVEP